MDVYRPSGFCGSLSLYVTHHISTLIPHLYPHTTPSHPVPNHLSHSHTLTPQTSISHATTPIPHPPPVDASHSSPPTAHLVDPVTPHLTPQQLPPNQTPPSRRNSFHLVTPFQQLFHPIMPHTLTPLPVLRLLGDVHREMAQGDLHVQDARHSVGHQEIASPRPGTLRQKETNGVTHAQGGTVDKTESGDDGQRKQCQRQRRPWSRFTRTTSGRVCGVCSHGGS